MVNCGKNHPVVPGLEKKKNQGTMVKNLKIAPVGRRKTQMIGKYHGKNIENVETGWEYCWKEQKVAWYLHYFVFFGVFYHDRLLYRIGPWSYSSHIAHFQAQ